MSGCIVTQLREFEIGKRGRGGCLLAGCCWLQHWSKEGDSQMRGQQERHTWAIKDWVGKKKYCVTARHSSYVPAVQTCHWGHVYLYSYTAAAPLVKTLYADRRELSPSHKKTTPANGISYVCGRTSPTDSAVHTSPYVSVVCVAQGGGVFMRYFKDFVRLIEGSWTRRIKGWTVYLQYFRLSEI